MTISATPNAFVLNSRVMRYALLACMGLWMTLNPRSAVAADAAWSTAPAPTLPPLPPPASLESVALLPLRALGDADVNLARALNDTIASAVRQHAPGLQQLSADQTRDVLLHAQQEDALQCMQTLCIAAAGHRLGVASVIVGALSKGQNYLLTLTWVATREATVLDRHTEVLGDDIDAFAPRVAQAVAALMRRASPALLGSTSPSVRTTRLCAQVRSALCERSRACDRADAGACYALAQVLEEGGAAGQTRDVALAADSYRAGCDHGMTQACCELARLWMTGQGVVRNQLAAIALYERSCRGGVAQACAEAADVYNYGLGEIKHDPVRAARLYDSATRLYQRQCDQGEAPACTSLAAFYDYGQILNQNAARAAQLYQRGCDLGGASACSNLGELYERGHGVVKDWARALELFKRGCSLGDSTGCASLAEMTSREAARPLRDR